MSFCDANNSKLPKRIKLGAIRHTIAPFSNAAFPSYMTSRTTSSPVETKDKERVVGTPK